MARHETEARVKVLSIVGTGRSGTTVLAAILGETPGIFNAGELHWVWGRSLSQQRPCGCGLPPAECPVWSRVVERALGVPPADQAVGRGGPAIAEIELAEHDLIARRNRLKLLRSARSHVQWPALDRMRAVTEGLYASLVAVTGAHVVVDASKRPEDAAVLAGIDSLDHYVLQIMRDPRAVVYSWSQAKASPDGTTVMRSMRPPRIVTAWLENNVGAELLRKHVPPERWFSTRYEDFVARPRDVVSDILAFLGEPGKAPFTDRDTVVLGVNHTLLGNPDRFRTGPVRIAPDDRWRSGMSWRLHALVAGATLPLMLRYGYLRVIRRGS
jgi:Sulfotransferase domain